MKSLFSFFTLLFFLQIHAQKPCDLSTDVSDSLGTLKQTKDVLMYEKVFGNAEQFIYFSLLNDNKTPLLSVNFIQKDSEFIKADCFDPSSKLFLQLSNQKIIPLFYADEESCSQLIQGDANGKNTRLLSGYFLFPKESFQMLKEHDLVFIRIKSSTGTKDFYVKDLLISEITKQSGQPTKFFRDYLHCVEN
ncbi:MAG: hypothetical protein ACK4K1_04930 [Flavobacterium sp.]